MILGIGVDIAEIERFEKLYARFGDKFLGRILTEAERREFMRRHCPAAYLATRFAAKEAAVKALGTGFSNKIGYKCVQIENDLSGKPYLCFLRAAKVLADTMQVQSSHLSMSDEKHHVVAMVVLEG